MDLQIRKLVLQDQEEFLTMSRQFYASEAVLHDIDAEYHLQAFAELMRSDVYLDGYILETEGQIIGYGLLNKSFSREVGGAVIWIEELYLKPEYRGQGLGSQFFSWLEANIPAARYRLEVEPSNAKALLLYERIGYQKLPYIQMFKG